MKRVLSPAFLPLILAITILLAGNSPASPPIEKYVLSNGIKLILKEEHSRPIISLVTFVDGGSRIESPEVSGVSHFIEHLVFRGPTSRFKELELRRKFRDWGDFSGYTEKDSTCYGFTTRPDDFAVSLDAFIDGIMNLTIPESCIEKERIVVTQEIHQRGDTPEVKLFDLFGSTALKLHPYKNPVIGYEKLIQNLGSNVIRGYYKEHYVPDHLVIAVVGDFASDDVKSSIEKGFSEYKTIGKNFEPGMAEPPQDSERSAVSESDINSMHLLMGWKISPAREKVYPSFEVLADILGNGDDSRLYKKLKIDSSLADEVYCFSDSGHDMSFFDVYSMAPPENSEKIRTAIMGEIEKIAKAPPSEDELARAKRRILNDFNFNQETFWDQAQFLARWELYGNLEMGFDWIKAISSVKGKDISEAASKYLTAEKLTWVSLLPKPEEKAETPPQDVPYATEASGFNLDEKKFGSTVLLNGAKLVFKRDTSSNIVGITVLAGDGQLVEPEGKEGVCNFIARMLLEGAGDLDKTALAKKIEELGARVNTSADKDFIRITMEVEKDRFQESLGLLEKILFEPKFDSVEMERIRKEILAEIERKSDDSFTVVNEKFDKAIYGDTPYGSPVEGFADTVELINRDDLLSTHSIAFAPKNLIIGIAGDIDPEVLSKVANRYLGAPQNSPRSVETSKNIYPTEQIPPESNKEEIINLPRTQVSFNLGMEGLSATDPDFPALKLLVGVLGWRVFDKYVYDLGWAYRMWFYMPTRKWQSVITFEMGVDTDKFEEARKGLIDAMTEVTQKPIPQDEFDETLHNTLQSFQLAMQKNADISFYLAFYEKVGLGYRYVADHDKIYSQLTPADLSRVARKYFHPDKLALVAIIPSSETK